MYACLTVHQQHGLIHTTQIEYAQLHALSLRQQKAMVTTLQENVLNSAQILILARLFYLYLCVCLSVRINNMATL